MSNTIKYDPKAYLRKLKKEDKKKREGDTIIAFKVRLYDIHTPTEAEKVNWFKKKVK